MDTSLILNSQYRMKKRALNKIQPSRVESQAKQAAAIETDQYLIPDSHAFNLLRQELSSVSGTNSSDQSQKLTGYELYVIEQWACERRLNTTVTAYTGNSNHHITVRVLSIPTQRSHWTPLVAEYFDDTFRQHLRPKETELGKLFVTSLSSFPSNLNLVRISGGNLDQAKFYFLLNEGLRRTGCGGRALLSVSKPSAASESKFRTLFKIHDKVPIEYAVVELVTLVQISLLYCGLLDAKYVDGLLCNYTAQAISAWWDKWGRIVYHTRPNESILGPAKLAGIIGFITAVRDRLAVVGTKPPKDPFDANDFFRSLKHFQKHENLPRVSKIDNETYFRLVSLTEKKSNSELLGMVKSAMKEVSGKTVQGIADAETLDVERLVSTVQGARSKYLWLGKGSMKVNLGAAHDFCQETGIPLSALSTTDDHPSGNLEFGKNMIRSVVTHRKQKSELPPLSPSVATKTEATSERPAYANQEPDIYDADVADHSNPMNPNKLNVPVMSSATASAVEQIPVKPKLDRDTAFHGHHMHKHRRERLRKHGHHMKEKYFGNHKQFLEPQGISSYSSSDEEELENTPFASELEDDMSESSRDFDPVDYISGMQHHLDDIILDWRPCQSRCKEASLTRRYSFSDVEEVINSTPSEVVALCTICKGLYRIAYYHEQLENQSKEMQKLFEVHSHRVGHYEDVVEQKTLTVERAHNRLQTLSAKQAALKSQVVDLDSVGARLQYETRMIQGKMREVEEAVDVFCNRVEALESRIANVVNRRQEPSIIASQLSQITCLWSNMSRLGALFNFGAVKMPSSENSMKNCEAVIQDTS